MYHEKLCKEEAVELNDVDAAMQKIA